MEPEPRPAPPPSAWRAQLDPVRAHVRAPGPPPREQGPLGLVRYGLAQPFLGLRVLLGSRDLLGMALAPAVGLLIIAALVSWRTATELGVLEGLAAYFLTVATLAPLPSVLFGRVYAHLAAKARTSLELPPAQPYVRGIVKLATEWLCQALILTIGAVPYVIFARMLPLVGAVAALGVQAAWAGHWIVVEAYDNARTLPEGLTTNDLEAREREGGRDEWFSRLPRAIAGVHWIIGLVLTPVVVLVSLVQAFARTWRHEVELVEREPWISLGFGLGAGIMLAVPGLNLLLRPAVVVAGVHLRHHLGADVVPAAAPTKTSTQPYPALPPQA